MFGFASSFTPRPLKSTQSSKTLNTRCAIQSSAANEKVANDLDLWRTPKVRASRPIRGVRRSAQGQVRVQGSQNAVRRPPPGTRVTSGTARGRKLRSPNVYLRPMMGKVREALFSMLVMMDAIRPEGSILDLFAGSGSVGLEALSRGVGNAVFVDFAPECIDTIGENAERCGFQRRSQVVCAKVEDFLPDALAKNGGKPYSIITITPPYEEVVYSELLTAVATSDCVGEGTIVVVEYPLELKSLPSSIAHRLIGVRNRRYGRTAIAIYACQPRIDIELRPEEFII